MEPLSQLPESEQDALLQAARQVQLDTGDIVYRQGDQDDHANFLIDGSVEMFWGGKSVKIVDARDKAATQVLDSVGAKRFTVVAKSPVTLLQLSRSALDKKLRMVSVSDKLSHLKPPDSGDARWPAWKMRLIRSPLFKVLPISQLKEALNHMERVEIKDGEVVVHQGTPGDYYYVVDEGSLTVTREALAGGVEIHVADLSAGDAFGEEALITGASRNATVTAQGSCRLMRMDKSVFMDMVLAPLVQEITPAEARSRVAAGAVWVDVRSPDRFAAGGLDEAINIPLTLLRVDCRRLAGKRPYVVCAQDTVSARVGALLLRQRGFDAVCVNTAVDTLLAGEDIPENTSTAVVRFPAQAEQVSAEEPAPGAAQAAALELDPVEQAQAEEQRLKITELNSTEPIPRDLYDDTYVGQSLADLIEQMHSRHEQAFDNASPNAADTQAVELDQFQAQVNEVLPSVEDTPPASISAVPTAAEVMQNLPDDALRALVTEFENGFRAYLSRRQAEAAEQLRSELMTRIAAVKEAAVHEVRRQAEAFQTQYRTEQARKKANIHAQYKELLTIANKISRQKAELQHARKELQLKLETTAQLQTEVDGIRSALTQRIGNFDSLEHELSESLQDSDHSGS